MNSNQMLAIFCEVHYVVFKIYAPGVWFQSKSAVNYYVPLINR